MRPAFPGGGLYIEDVVDDAAPKNGLDNSRGGAEPQRVQEVDEEHARGGNRAIEQRVAVPCERPQCLSP